MTALRTDRRIAGLLLFVLLLEIPAAFLIDGPRQAWMPAYRLLHLAQMLALIGLIAQRVAVNSPQARWVLAGLLLSFAGDLVNSFLIDLSAMVKPQILLSIPAFVLAHLCYLAAYGRVLGWRPPSATARKLRLGMAVLWLPLSLMLWRLVIDPEAPPLLLSLSVGYAMVVVLMGLVALWLPMERGRIALWPALGGLLFVVSDSLLGAYLLHGDLRPVWVSQLIWISYFAAQCGVAHTVGIQAAADQSELISASSRVS